jgi:hypothetical protein
MRSFGTRPEIDMTMRLVSCNDDMGNAPQIPKSFKGCLGYVSSSGRGQREGTDLEVEFVPAIRARDCESGCLGGIAPSIEDWRGSREKPRGSPNDQDVSVLDDGGLDAGGRPCRPSHGGMLYCMLHSVVLVELARSVVA